MANQQHLVLIGGGNMGEALVAGLLRSKQWKPAQITVADIRTEALNRVEKLYEVGTTGDAPKAVRSSSIIILAVKPQHARDVIRDIAPAVGPDQLLISIAAGLTTACLESHLAKGVPVIRMMPNMPAVIGMAASTVARGRHAAEAHLQQAVAIFSTVGVVEEVRESDMDAVTAVSGSGPAYVFYLAEAMRDAAVQMGLARRVADRLVRQTIRGTGEMLARSSDPPEVLRQRVSSPGGTTEAAIRTFDQAKLRSIFSKALHNARRRARELSKEAGGPSNVQQGRRRSA